MSATKNGTALWERLTKRADATRVAGDGRLDVWDAVSQKFDVAEYRPKLAADIEIREFKLKWGNDYVMFANPRHLVHYRFGPEDAELVKLMDGTRTVKEIVIDRFKETGDLELSSVVDMVETLREEDFFEDRYVDVNAAVRRAMKPTSTAATKVLQFARSRRVEWTRADRFVRTLYDGGLKHVFTRPFLIVSLALVLAGLAGFFSIVRSQRFGLAGESLAIGFVILLFLDYFSVFLHELGHALVLIRNKRKVKSAGFEIYFLSPAFFIESSESLMIDRRQSMLMSFAGPYTQLIVGGVCSLVAWAFPEWIFSPTLYKAAVINYFMVFMNLLPMLELDGYFLLSDAIQVPDLRPRSLAFIRHDFWHKLRNRERFSKAEIGLALYGGLGVLFTGSFLISGTFYWRTVFADLARRLWLGGVFTRAFLIVLVAFLASPLIRGAINLARAVVRLGALLVRRLKFRLEQSWRVEAAQLIDALPLFDDLPVEVLNDLAGRVRLRAFAPGQSIVRQGDRASAFFVVRRGRLEVVEENPETGVERTIRVLDRGEAFGELGLKQGSRRSATVRAVGDSEVFEIDKSTFDRLLVDTARLPDFAPTVQAFQELKEMKCFSHLEPDELGELLEHGEWVKVKPGEYLIEQGEIGDSFYAIGSGQADVFEDGDLKTTLGPGAFFGEIALLLSVPRTATVVAKTPMRVFKLDREGFDRLVRDSFKRGTLNPTRALDRTAAH
ncbi:MAG TPA: cyclic nucleotide-binding domain-containing protein [Actinomycetota bacterium]|nr:cyclic nucleotide-binding domain-containing protein [Actinomycetota bacterium]